MVLPICQRVTYWRSAVPVIFAAVAAGFERSTIFVVTVRVLPDRLMELLRMSMPGTLAPPITGNRASPKLSVIPVVGAFDGPETFVPNRPGPEDCRAIVITPAPAWSTVWLPVGVNPGCARPLEVSS